MSFLELDSAFADATAESAAAYLDGVMDACVKSGINTVFFHVRAHSDCYYASKLFPPAASTKELLAAGFDPLAYAVKAAHARGLSLHAWINPYRIGEQSENAVCADVFRVDDCWYYIPSSLSAQRCILDGVREVVQGYAVDGVQYDDYFYPAGTPATAQAFEKPPAGVPLARWRQAAVSALVSATYSAVHSRDGCLFGISPAGNLSRCTDKLFADLPRFAAVTGYVDYLCPQLYSGFENTTLPYEKEADDWAALSRAAGVRLYAGLAVYKTGESDLFAGSGSGEWQNHSDILLRQTQYAAKKGYAGVSLFRLQHWTAPGGDIRTKEIAALTAHFVENSAQPSSQK